LGEQRSSTCQLWVGDVTRDRAMERTPLGGEGAPWYRWQGRTSTRIATKGCRVA